MYKELLEKLNESGLRDSFYRLLIAKEVSGAFDVDNEYFNDICDYCYDYFMSSEISAEELANLAFRAISLNMIVYEDFRNEPDKVDDAIYNLM